MPHDRLWRKYRFKEAHKVSHWSIVWDSRILLSISSWWYSKSTQGCQEFSQEEAVCIWWCCGVHSSDSTCSESNLVYFLANKWSNCHDQPSLLHRANSKRIFLCYLHSPQGNQLGYHYDAIVRIQHHWVVEHEITIKDHLQKIQNEEYVKRVNKKSIKRRKLKNRIMKNFKSVTIMIQIKLHLWGVQESKKQNKTKQKRQLSYHLLGKIQPEYVHNIPWGKNGTSVFQIKCDEDNGHDKKIGARWWKNVTSNHKSFNEERKFGISQGILVVTTLNVQSSLQLQIMWILHHRRILWVQKGNWIWQR